jgi:hypothetical protein
VSTFNIVATLVMTVQEKKRDIGVLSVMGAQPGFASRVFLWLGCLLGGVGILAGVAFGWLVCVTATATRLLSFPGVAEIHFVSFIPFLVRLRDTRRSSDLPPWSSSSRVLGARTPGRPHQHRRRAAVRIGIRKDRRRLTVDRVPRLRAAAEA